MNCLPVKQVRVELSELDPPKKPRLEKQENRSSPITVQTSKDLLPNISDYDETNADDFAMEMGLACVVCRYILIKLGYHPSVLFNCSAGSQLDFSNSKLQPFLRILYVIFSSSPKLQLSGLSSLSANMVDMFWTSTFLHLQTSFSALTFTRR